LAVCAACSACGPRLPAGAREPATLPADRPYLGTLVLDEESEQFFRLALPPDALAVAIELESSDADLALEAKLDAVPPLAREDGDFSATTDAGRARIVIDRFTEPALAGDVLTLRVAWESRARPRSSTRELDDLPFTLRARVHRARSDGELALGRDAQAVVG